MEFQAEMKYVLDTIWLLIGGAFVIWMAAGFAMLEAGLVRSKNTTAILTKNITLYSVACIAFYLVGYNLMFGEGDALMGSGFALSGTSSESHSLFSDFFFQVVFVATAASIVSGTLRTDSLSAVSSLHISSDGIYLPDSDSLELGWNSLGWFNRRFQ